MVDRVSEASGEQLDLFTDAQHVGALLDGARGLLPPMPPARPRARRPVAGTSNDMGLVAEVLATAMEPGYLVEDTAAGTRVWRASGPVDPRRELPLLERATRDEATMITQLLERGWLHRGARAQTRTGLQRGQSSGRRRFEVPAHALTVPAHARHSLARWNALAATPTPTQHTDPS